MWRTDVLLGEIERATVVRVSIVISVQSAKLGRLDSVSGHQNVVKKARW
jgi:hypothetical protein